MNPSDVVTFNGPMITAARKSRNLTQEALADAADLSDRVVRKAESGGEVRFSTLMTLADALRDAGSNVKAGDQPAVLR